jgi:hypothetical protein
MFIGLLAFLAIANSQKFSTENKAGKFNSSQGFPTENKAEKFNACYYLTKLKVALDKEGLDALVKLNKGDTEKVGNRVTSDMLLKCYKAISLETAVKILEQGEELYYTEEYDPLVLIDLDTYKDKNFSITSEHKIFYDEVKKLKQEAEELAEKPPTPQPPLPPVGVWYILVVLLVFIGFFYWATKRVLIKPEPKNKAKSKKNKKKQ